MPGQPAVHHDEAAQLLAYVAQQRDGLRYAAFGLTDEQARLTPTAGSLSVGGLIVHVTAMEHNWIDMVATGMDAAGLDTSGVARPDAPAVEYEEGFRLAPGQTLAAAIADLDAAAARTVRAVAAIPDLELAVPVPKGVPWFPQDLDAWTVRWVLMHLVEEIARHAGHADIVRESIDGATMFELMAGAEGWPATDWLTPWSPPV